MARRTEAKARLTDDAKRKLDSWIRTWQKDQPNSWDVTNLEKYVLFRSKDTLRQIRKDEATENTFTDVWIQLQKAIGLDPVPARRPQDYRMAETDDGVGTRLDFLEGAPESDSQDETLESRILEQFSVRTLQNHADVAAVYSIEQLEYGPETLSLPVYLRWWDRYAHGTFALVRDDQIVGAVGMWPLTEHAYSRLITGQLEETDLRDVDIQLLRNRREWPYWYWADIILDKKLRSTEIPFLFFRSKLANRMVRLALEEWLFSCNLSNDISIVAIRYTGVGESFLTNFGFFPCTNDKDGSKVLTPDSKKEVWRLDCSRRDVLNMKRELERFHRRFFRRSAEMEE